MAAELPLRFLFYHAFFVKVCMFIFFLALLAENCAKWKGVTLIPNILKSYLSILIL